jgi:hypothetical protein
VLNFTLSIFSVTEFEHLPTSTKQFPKIKRKRGRPKKKIVKNLYKNDHNNKHIRMCNNDLFNLQEIVEINNQPITSNSNQNMVPKKKWRLAYLNNGNKSINS